MGRSNSVRVLYYALVTSVVFLVTSVIFINTSQALTASYGAPYHGRLENGVPFPTQFPGYQLREENHTRTTPEVIGALLDAIEAVRTQFPDTCDVYLGDFTVGSGGSTSHHRSHQNGRDVDIGMYAKGNRPLNGFTPMNEDILDAPKTWCLVENIIRSQRVQYIFLDRRVQKVLYNYAVTLGYDQAYLDRVFGNVRGSLLQHVPNHYDHIHVRFFTPWSTLAAHIGGDEAEKNMVIDMAQQSYLPKKVNYYVNGSENSIDALARSFGVTRKDLCKWNQLGPSSPLIPGSCLVFFKRSFESEPVHLARSLQPGYIAEAPRIRTAALNTEVSQPTVTDADRSDSVAEPRQQDTVREKRAEKSVSADSGQTYIAQRGDTLEKIARRNNMDVQLLCQLNGVKKTAELKPGQTVKISVPKMLADAGPPPGKSSRKSSSSAICFASDPKKPDSPTAAYYTAGKRETLQSISRKSGISINVLCQLNGLKRDTSVKPGQKIKLTQANLPVKPSLGTAACSIKDSPGHQNASSAKGASQKDLKRKDSKQIESKAANKTAVKTTAAASKTQDKSKAVDSKSTAKTASVTKTVAKTSASSKDAVKKSAPQKTVSKEASTTNKVAPASAKKPADGKAAAVKPGQNKPGQPVGQLAKNSKK